MKDKNSKKDKYRRSSISDIKSRAALDAFDNYEFARIYGSFDMYEDKQAMELTGLEKPEYRWVQRHYGELKALYGIRY